MSQVEMAEMNILKHECVVGATEEYFTEFKWILKHWTLLYESTYRHRIDSPNFLLNGTAGYTCKVSLDPVKDKPLIIELSDTADILAMKVTNSINNVEFHNNFFNSDQIKKSNEYRFNVSLRKGSSNYIFPDKNCFDDTLTILVNILIIKQIVSSESLNKREICLKKSSIDHTQHNGFLLNTVGNLKAMFDSKTLFDVTFVLGDIELSAHKAILAAQSKVFEAMFVSSLREQKENRVEINDTEIEVFKEFLNYLYTGEVNDLETIVEEMIVVADYYQVGHLKTMCEDLMLENLCEKNVVRYAIIANKLCCNALKEQAVHLIRNSQKVLVRALTEENSEILICLKEVLNNVS